MYNVRPRFKFNKSLLWIIAVFISTVFGTIVGITYPSWYNSLAFKDSIPDFLRPPKALETVKTDKGETLVRTVEESAVIDVVDKASPAVVSILAKQVTFDPRRGPTTDEQGIGTGFIVDSSGIILTNDHVVSDKTITYTVLTKDQKSYSVVSIDRDSSNDFAIIKINASNLPTIGLGDSSSLKVGQKVVAIGNALGRFQNTVTVGVVSGIGRGVTASDQFGFASETLENVIQTDAALNPGNSGGPLLDLSGKVVGINFATTSGAENIGFVIPINRVKSILEQFKSQGRIIKPFIGIAYNIIGSDIAQLQNLPEGAYVQRVIVDSPAAKAGIEIGDVITELGGEKITLENSLATIIRKFNVGDKVKLKVNRKGKNLQFEVKLEEAPRE